MLLISRWLLDSAEQVDTEISLPILISAEIPIHGLWFQQREQFMETELFGIYSVRKVIIKTCFKMVRHLLENTYCFKV